MAICRITKTEKAELDKLIGAYDSARSDLLDFLSSIQADWETEIERTSEKWRESESGQEAQGRLDTLTSWIDELPDDAAMDADQLA